MHVWILVAKQTHMTLNDLIIEFSMQVSVKLQVLYVIACDNRRNDGVVYGHWRCVLTMLHRLSVHTAFHYRHR